MTLQTDEGDFFFIVGQVMCTPKLCIILRFFQHIYEGCPSKSLTSIITLDCVQVTLWYLKDVFIYISETCCTNRDGIAVKKANL